MGRQTPYPLRPDDHHTTVVVVVVAVVVGAGHAHTLIGQVVQLPEHGKGAALIVDKIQLAAKHRRENHLKTRVAHRAVTRNVCTVDGATKPQAHLLPDDPTAV